jgi:hypothetical protein
MRTSAFKGFLVKYFLVFKTKIIFGFITKTKVTFVIPAHAGIQKFQVSL